jgi:tetratricopeptide (TPR) repeat protein
MITQKKMHGVAASVILVGLIFLTGCGGAYKASGQYKRDLLLDRIEKARQSHEQAKKQFEVVLANYSNIIDANAGDIRGEYNKLNRECKRARKITKDINRSVQDVQDVGKPLFRSWEDELSEYKNEDIRRTSEEQLEIARSNYLKLVHTMKSSESIISTVLTSLNDQVLFMSHNLNTKALSLFGKEVTSLKGKVDELVKHMQNAIKDAETFVDENGSVALPPKPEE